jgi:LemA protein
MMVANNQPNLKADKVVLSFMDEQAGAENRVATERKRFQETVETYNVKIRRFPANILAGMFGFQKREYYKSEAGAEKAPKVKF